MSTIIEKYVVKHISGSKVNQVEEFDFSKNELSIGRSSSNEIQFDPEKEVIVSREHGKITKTSSDPVKFSITDNNSRNGIFVNKIRVKGSAELHPGDEVQLGNNGPVFSFDIYPRPQDMMQATRVVEIPASLKATTISEIQEVPAVQHTEAAKVGLGKQTVERMLVSERKKSSNKMAWVIGSLLLMLGALGFAFKDQLFGKKQIITNINNVVTDSSNIGKKKVNSIAKENEDRVVQIEFAWELYDASNGKQLWHEYAFIKTDKNDPGRYAGKYIQTRDGKFEPYLDYGDKQLLGIPVGMSGASGSGFVVSADGFIMTNRHVGASWNTRYGVFPQSTFPGVVVDAAGNVMKDKQGKPYDVMMQDIFGWVPAKASMVAGNPVAPGTIQGRNKYLNVVFAGTSLRRPGVLTTTSDNHDVALIKVEIPQSLSPVTMKDTYTSIQPGDAVTVMGYPGIAPEQYVVRKSQDPFNQQSDFSSVPTPTVTPGSIGRIIPATSAENNTFSTFGDSYQLTLNATGSGNSGGPMFDDEGNVIGIFYASSSDASATRITFAVPIKYGLELMGIKKLNNR